MRGAVGSALGRGGRVAAGSKLAGRGVAMDRWAELWAGPQKRWAGLQHPQVPSQRSDPGGGTAHQSPRRGRRVPGPAPIGAGICRPKVELGNVESGWPYLEPTAPTAAAEPTNVLESTELPPPCTRRGHRSRARPASKGLAAWPGGTHPPAPARARLSGGRRQDPEPGLRAPRCGPALRARSLGCRPEVGAGGGSRHWPGAGGAKARLPHSARSFPHSWPPSSSRSYHLLQGGDGRRGQILDSREVWVPRKETVNGGSL